MVAGLLRLIGEPAAAVSDRAAETGRILVVDDNASNRRLLIRRLELEGHSVTEADSGRAALQILAGERIDLVLLDLLMPDMNGFEVLQRLKSDERLREIPVIMISGLQEMASVIRCIELGAEDFLPKPFDPVLLKARITASLERKRWHDRERHYLDQLESEKEKVEVLLHNILPGRIVSRLSDGEAVIADRFDDVSILFCDIVNFTALASRLPSAVVVSRLNNIFSEFDALTRRLEVEKIKTIGDAYMAAAGLPEPRGDHAEVMAELAFGMLDALERINRTSDDPLKVRIGIHSGPVVAGVIGTHKFIYDVWGDTVNIAARLEAHGIPDKVHVSEATRRSIAGRFFFEPRHVDNIKGVGTMSTFLLSRRVELSQQPKFEPTT
jgi:class 3 adenylate cyclase